MIPKEQLEVLRNEVPIKDLISKKLEISCINDDDGYFRFECPICKQYDTATNKDTNLGRCFSCERNYNPIDITITHLKLTFLDTVEYLIQILDRIRMNERLGVNNKCMQKQLNCQ